MRDRSRAVRAVAALAGAALLGGAAPADNVNVSVTVSGLRSDRGVVLACMTTDPDRFPRCRDDGASYRLSVPANSGGTLRFRGVRPGTYAIALLHDENGNGKADRALSMIPKEGFGFSRDAPVRMGPPSFSDAAFEVGRTAVNQRITMRYML